MKSKIPVIRGGISFGDIKINCLSALAWWVMYLSLRGKNINLNNFKSDVLSDTIEDYRLDFGDTIYGKWELINPKEFSHEKWTQWEDSIYN